MPRGPIESSPDFLCLTDMLNKHKNKVVLPIKGDGLTTAQGDAIIKASSALEPSDATLEGEEYQTHSAAYIMQTLVSEWRQQFLEKNAAYGEDKDPLGSSAEFVEIWRKARKLRRALWEMEDIGEEDVREVAMDMIGHLFLLIHILDSDQRLIEVVPDSDPEAWVDPDGGDPIDVGRAYPGRYA